MREAHIRVGWRQEPKKYYPREALAARGSSCSRLTLSPSPVLASNPSLHLLLSSPPPATPLHGSLLLKQRPQEGQMHTPLLPVSIPGQAQAVLGD